VLGKGGEVFRVRGVGKPVLARRLVRAALGLLAGGRKPAAPKKKKQTSAAKRANAREAG
jgi:hypothetical protein